MCVEPVVPTHTWRDPHRTDKQYNAYCATPNPNRIVPSPRERGGWNWVGVGQSGVGNNGDFQWWIQTSMSGRRASKIASVRMWGDPYPALRLHCRGRRWMFPSSNMLPAAAWMPLEAAVAVWLPLHPQQPGSSRLGWKSFQKLRPHFILFQF